MEYGIQLKVWGDYACFTNPLFKIERFSYPVITPSAARGVVDAIYWHPGFRWVVDKIHVLKDIQYINIKRNELVFAEKAPTGQINVEDYRTQRNSQCLKDVEYIIEAHFELLNTKDKYDLTDGKILDIFKRRLSKGNSYYRPFLGCREFGAYFSEVTEIPESPFKGVIDFGSMVRDRLIDDPSRYSFFNCVMEDGVITVK